MGVRPGIQLFFGVGREVQVRTPGLQHSVFVRPGTSDYSVFYQVLRRYEYKPMTGLPDVGLIFDLGANVGYTSAYLLSQYPHARLVAVEPDEGNYQMLQRNLSPYGDRALAIRGAVWNRPCTLTMAEKPYRDGADWSRQVQESFSESAIQVSGYDMPSLMKMAGATQVDILKVDIEGAEVLLFDQASKNWIDNVRNIAIELHDDSAFGVASPVFWRAVLDKGYRFGRSGELILCFSEAR